MSIFEYDQEKHMRQEREQEYAAGKKDGLEEGRKEGWKEGWKKGWKEGWREGWEEGRIIMLLFQQGVSIEEIAAAVGKQEEEVKRIIAE